MIGITESLLNDIENENVAHKINTEFLMDFVNIAKENLRNNFYKSAAVRASATLERMLRSLAIDNGMLEYKNLTCTIHWLCGKARVLQGDQASIAKSFVELRNDCFHGDWDNITKEDTRRLPRRFHNTKRIRTHHIGRSSQ